MRLIILIIQYLSSLAAIPLPLPVWSFTLMLNNLVPPIVFISHVEGKVALVTALLVAVIKLSVFARHGFVRLLGLSHFAWLPMMIFFCTRFSKVESNSFLWFWMISIIALNSISLIFDVANVFKYFHGAKEPTIISYGK